MKKLTFDNLNDGRLYEIQNILSLARIENFYVNDRNPAYARFDAKHSSEEAMIIEILAAKKEFITEWENNSFQKRMYDGEPFFVISPDSLSISSEYKDFIESSNLLFYANLMFRYDKTSNSLVEPLTNLKIRLLDKSDIREAGDVDYKFLNDEIEKCINVSPIVIDKSVDTKIMEVRKEDFGKGSNHLYKGFFDYIKKDSLFEFKDRFEKVKNVTSKVDEVEEKNKKYIKEAKHE